MRPGQVESQLARVLSDSIAELRDPRVPLIVTVERVTVTSDFALARVYLSTLGEVGPLLEALHGARGHLQREVGRHIKLRRIPQLEFYPAAEAPL